MEAEKQAFLDAIAADRYDRDTRLAFSDWLEEHGLDDEAAEQRRMASPQWVEAARWLEDLASQLGCPDSYYGDPGAKFTFDMLVQIGREFTEQDEYFTQVGSETARDMTWSWPGGNIAALFWTHWQTVTGKTMDANKDLDWPFSCTC